MRKQISVALLQNFHSSFKTDFEDRANQTRGAFLRAFPINTLRNLTLDQYVIGKGTPSFCAYVEAKTKSWANILGATSFKFGIYFGKTKSDARKRYRFTNKFGSSEKEAFTNVKAALLSLIDAGVSEQFENIDENSLSQMFKAKILSLYFPDKYLNVCSGEHIQELASEFGLPDTFLSEQQHLLLQIKQRNIITQSWSNPKFMTFLYNTYFRRPADAMHVKSSRKRRPPTIDINELLENFKRIGKISEDFAFDWEKERLLGRGFKDLIAQIEDRRNAPSSGYDFLSFTAPGEQRLIEVKSAGKNRTGDGYRFFLSETECKISHSNPDTYYFYLVYYDRNGKPCDLEARRATNFYDDCELGPNGYVATFNREVLKE
jgi:hypothetical protein